MQKPACIHFAKLLGFDTVSDELPSGLDFKDETLGDKLGAKVGQESNPSPAQGINFSDETLGAKLGAKIGGGVESMTPAKR